MADVKIDAEFARLMQKLAPEELAALEASIGAEGCRDALVLWQGILIDGHHRYEICTRRGIPFKIVEVSLPDRLAVKIWILQNQLARRNLTDDQRSMYAADLADLLSQQAKRERAAKGTPAREASKAGHTLVTDAVSKVTERSRAKAAKIYRVSERKVSKAARVRKKAPALAKKVKSGEMSLAAATREVDRRDREANRGDQKTLDNTAGKFAILYSDPPWQYDFSLSGSREIENQYPTLTVEQICALPVPAIAEADAVLFLWATSPKLPEALRVMAAWGFTYKTCMVWVKDKIGMGYYARQRHELLLIGTVGKPPVPAPENRPDSVIEAPRRDHSQKPEAARKAIEAMYPNGSRIELFARQAAEGWSAWGNETL